MVRKTFKELPPPAGVHLLGEVGLGRPSRNRPERRAKEWLGWATQITVLQSQPSNRRSVDSPRSGLIE